MNYKEEVEKEIRRIEGDDKGITERFSVFLSTWVIPMIPKESFEFEKEYEDFTFVWWGWACVPKKLTFAFSSFTLEQKKVILEDESLQGEMLGYLKKYQQ
jgi:hypothetical protein